MAKREIGTKIKLDGEAEFKAAVNNINQSVKVMASEMAAVTSSFDKNSASVADLEAKGRIYEKQVEAQNAKLAEYNKILEECKSAQDKASAAVAEAKEKFGAESAEVKKAEQNLAAVTAKLNNYQKESNYTISSLNKLEAAQKANNEAMDKLKNSGFEEAETKFKTSVDSLDQSLKVMASEMNAVTSSYDKNKASISDLKNKNQIYEKQIEAQKAKLSEYNKILEECKSAQDKASTAVVEAKEKFGAESAEVKKAEQNLAAVNSKLSEYQVGANDTKKSLNQLEAAEKANNEEIRKLNDNAANTKGWKKFSGAVKVAATALKAVGVAVGAAAAGISTLVKNSTEAYANYEQLVGGAELMWDSAYGYIEERAKNAYKNVQMSSADYLEQVNGLATGLINAMGATTPEAQRQAAELADRIVSAEADLVAATGETQENIQNAFNGIMKSNFTMLDNLHLGIAPTKEGMQEIIDKTNEWNAANGKATQYQMGNLADMQSALVDYVEMNKMAGYAAMEGADTISGSLASAKAAWDNLVVGLADKEADLDGLITNFVGTATIAGNQLMPVVEKALNGIAQLIEGILPIVATALPNIISEILPDLMDSAISFVSALGAGISENLEPLMNSAFEVINSLVNFIIENAPALLEASIEIMATIISGIAGQLPTLIPAAVQLILDLTESIIENVDQLVDATIAIATGLAEGLIAALPILLERAPEIIGKLVAALMEATPQILTAAVEVVASLQVAIASALPQIIDTIGACLGEIYLKIVDGGKKWADSFEDLGGKIYDWVQGLKTKLKEAFGKIIEDFTELITPALDIGRNIIEGIANGIKEQVGKVKDKIKGACSELLDNVKSFFGIHSPSTVFKEQVGENLALGLSEGFTEKMGKLSGDMSDAVSDDYKIGVTVTDAKSAKKAIDVIVKDYQSGLLNRAQYDKLYNQTLEKCVKKRTEVEEYANQKLVAADKKAAQNRQKEVLSIAKEQVDDIVKAYKEGEISLAEMNELYNQVYQTCADERVEIEEYAGDKITAARKKVAEENLKELKSSIKSEITEYQKQIEDIQKSIATTSAKLSGDISDMYSFEKDDKGKLTAKLDKASQKQQQLNQYYTNLQKLINNGISDSMIEALADMSLEQGAALAENWAKLSTSDLNGVALQYENITKASDKISALLYDKKAKQVSEAMIASLGNITASSEEFAEIGGGIMDQMLAGLTSESSTSKIKLACDNIVKAFAEYFDIDIDTNLEEQLKSIEPALGTSTVATIDGNTYGTATRLPLGGTDAAAGGNTTIINQYNTFGNTATLADQDKASQRLVALIAT